MQHVVREFIASGPYEVFAEDDPNTGQRHAKVRVKRDVPAEWSAILGDIIHNARASLDLLMVAVVKHCDPGRASYNHVYFPIGDSKVAFETTLPKKTKGASADAQRIIKELKPYKGGDEAFYRLHQLDILDKHKAIIPVGAAHRNLGIALNPAKMFPDLPGVESLATQMLFLRPADRQFPLEDGAIVFSASSGEGTPFDDEIRVTVEIAFGEGQILEGEPLDPALTQIIEFVQGIVEIIERDILDK